MLKVAKEMLTARDIMKPNPISIPENAPLAEAAELFVEHGFTAAPVINDRGHAIGVISMTDLLRHERVKGGLADPAKESLNIKAPRRDKTSVRDIMTKAVFGVKPETPLSEITAIMLRKQVHRLFVTDEGGTLIGVVSTFDLLRHFAPKK